MAGSVAGRSARLALRVTSEDQLTFAVCWLRPSMGAIETTNGRPDFGMRNTIGSRPSFVTLTRSTNGSVRHQTYSACASGAAV